MSQLTCCRSLLATTAAKMDLPDFSRDPEPVNVDPNNSEIEVDVGVVSVPFLTHSIRVQGGATKCARMFLSFLAQQEELRDRLAAQPVLEVGSGTGLVGCALALGGAHVDLTDVAYVVEVLEANFSANLPEDLRRDSRCFELCWGDDVNVGDREYAAIFGSDLIYAKEAHFPLVQTFRKLGTAQTPVYLAYIHRFPWERRFFALMETLYDRELVQFEDGIYIFCFRPKEGARCKATPLLVVVRGLTLCFVRSFGTGDIEDLLEAAQISRDEEV